MSAATRRQAFACRVMSADTRRRAPACRRIKKISDCFYTAGVMIIILNFFAYGVFDHGMYRVTHNVQSVCVGHLIVAVNVAEFKLLAVERKEINGVSLYNHAVFSSNLIVAVQVAENACLLVLGICVRYLMILRELLGSRTGAAYARAPTPPCPPPSAAGPQYRSTAR